jgi:hypothetical protein
MKLLVSENEAKGNDEHHPSSTETSERGQAPGNKGLSATVPLFFHRNRCQLVQPSEAEAYVNNV